MTFCIMRKTLKSLRSVVNEHERDSASSTVISQVPFNDSNELKMLETDLAYIHTNLLFFVAVWSKNGAEDTFVVVSNKRDQQHS
jgi:hypothetical protein